MKIIIWSFVLSVGISFAGCATPQHRSDIAAVREATVQDSVLRNIERGQPLNLNEVILLSEKGVPDEVVIRAIRRSSAVYRLDTAIVTRLDEAGVGEAVIDEMLATSHQARTGRGYREVRYHPHYHRGFHPHRFHHRSFHHRHRYHHRHRW